MLHTKFHDNLSVFTIYGHGSHIGYVISIMLFNFHFLVQYNLSNPACSQTEKNIQIRQGTRIERLTFSRLSKRCLIATENVSVCFGDIFLDKFAFFTIKEYAMGNQPAIIMNTHNIFFLQRKKHLFCSTVFIE